jgi:hypothetical protein
MNVPEISCDRLAILVLIGACSFRGHRKNSAALGRVGLGKKFVEARFADKTPTLLPLF